MSSLAGLDEAYQLRCKHVLLDSARGLIQIAEGKSKAARRSLPMVPEVYHVLKARWRSMGKPT